jgi:hypothetical protein
MPQWQTGLLRRRPYYYRGLRTTAAATTHMRAVRRGSTLFRRNAETLLSLMVIPEFAWARIIETPSRRRRNVERWPVSMRHEQRGECHRLYSNRTTGGLSGRYPRDKRRVGQWRRGTVSTRASPLLRSDVRLMCPEHASCRAFRQHLALMVHQRPLTRRPVRFAAKSIPRLQDFLDALQSFEAYLRFQATGFSGYVAKL